MADDNRKRPFLGELESEWEGDPKRLFRDDDLSKCFRLDGKPRWHRVELLGLEGIDVGAIDNDNGVLTLVLRITNQRWPQGPIPNEPVTYSLKRNMTSYVVTSGVAGPHVGIGFRVGALEGIEIIVQAGDDLRTIDKDGK